MLAEYDWLLTMEFTLFDCLCVVVKFLIVFQFLITPYKSLLGHRYTLCRLYFLLQTSNSFCRIDFNLELFVRECFELEDNRSWILRLLFWLSSSLASLLILVSIVSSCCCCGWLLWYLLFSGSSALSFLLDRLHKLSMLFKLIHNRIFMCLTCIPIITTAAASTSSNTIINWWLKFIRLELIRRSQLIKLFLRDKEVNRWVAFTMLIEIV